MKATARAAIRAPKAEPPIRPAELKLGEDEAEVAVSEEEPDSEPEAEVPELLEPVEPEEEPAPEVEAAPLAEAEAEELLTLGVVEGRVPLDTAVKEEGPAEEAPTPAPEPEADPEVEPEAELEPDVPVAAAPSDF